MRALVDCLPGYAVQPTDVLGVPAQQVEALAFAWLAHAHAQRLPGNLPAVTGARGPRILGAYYPACPADRALSPISLSSCRWPSRPCRTTRGFHPVEACRERVSLVLRACDASCAPGEPTTTGGNHGSLDSCDHQPGARTAGLQPSCHGCGPE